MIIIFIKSIIVLAIVLFFVRLMGKRQIGEMQPFELVITLIIAEVACIPMNDPSIPFYNGIIPIVTLAAAHIILSFLSCKSFIIRRLLSGRAMIVIDKDGINYQNLKKMNINMNDLLESIRSSGYSDFAQIMYAIFETNGKMCIIEKWVDPTKPAEVYLPVILMVDGKWNRANLELAGVSEKQIKMVLKNHGIKNNNQILYIDIRQNGQIYVAPKNKKYFVESISIKGGGNW